jgi:hypothetical protein
MRLNPPEACAYLKTEHGVTLAVGTLANMRSRGDGPAYMRDGIRVVYDARDLDEFARKRIGLRVNNTTEERSMGRRLPDPRSAA